MLGFKLVILARYRMKPGEICAAVDLFEWAMVVRGSGIKVQVSFLSDLCQT